MDRQDRLLFLLVKENDCSKSIQEIAELFGVTARTIRNDIEALNDVLICNGARIKIKRKGISIEIQDKEKLEDYLQSIESNRERVLTAQDRVRQIIETLLTSDESVRMDDLADAMFISRATLKNDMKTVRSILADFGIEIDYRAYQGMRAIGSEQQYRLCLTRIQMEEPFYTQQLPENNQLDIIHKIITYFRYLGISSIMYDSIISPALISLKSWIPIPHSCPITTSFTSSLNRFSEPNSPSKIIIPSRITRILESFVTFPSTTAAPATFPTFDTLNTCLTSILPK